MRRYLLAITVMLAMHGCILDEKMTDTPSRKEDVPYFISEVKKGALYIEEGDLHYMLANDAIDYRVVPSTKATKLAVETMLLSNLTVVRFYEKREDGRYHPLVTEATNGIWENFSKKSGIDPDDLRYPRMKLIGWESEEKVRLKLFAGYRHKRVEEEVTISLD